MQVSCPNCPWKGKASERTVDRMVLCPKCKKKMLVQGTGMIVVPQKAVPEKPIPVIKIPPPVPYHEYDSDPEIELEIEPEPVPIVHDPGLIYQGERIRMYDDGRVTYPQWRTRDEAKSLQIEVKLALDEVKLAMRILQEEQRKTNAKYTIGNRAVGPSLFRYSNKKNTASFLYLAQLVVKAIVSVDNSASSHELEKRRAVTSQVKFNLEAIELQLRRFLQLGHH